MKCVSQLLSERPLVSIIVDNYNCDRYLGQAIDSALHQTFQPVEVIVVDDGSTDDSRAIIQEYDGRILPVFKQNGGQASAFNAGFACSQGEVVIFLDADDVLFPDTVEKVVQALRDHPDISKIQYRLEVIDERGERTGLLKPRIDQQLPNGDLKRNVLAFPDDLLWQPTSGNAFPAWVLSRIFPMPEEEYRICADYYLSNLSPLFGLVKSIQSPCGGYRIHSANRHHTSQFNLERTRQIIIRSVRTHGYIGEYRKHLGLDEITGQSFSPRSITLVSHRMISLKLDPERHPYQGDHMIPLCLTGMRASFSHFDLPLQTRLVYLFWCLTLLLAPKFAVKRLAEKFLNT
jgi:glycosyltransferase involved in cell wall biosynthesis